MSLRAVSYLQKSEGGAKPCLRIRQPTKSSPRAEWRDKLERYWQGVEWGARVGLNCDGFENGAASPFSTGFHAIPML